MEFIIHKPTILQLEIISSGLSAYDVPVLDSALSVSSALKYITLDHADFGPSAKYIINGIADNPVTVIKALSLRYCKICSDAQKEIAKLLSKVMSLT
jgi:hypothetical protein